MPNRFVQCFFTAMKSAKLFSISKAEVFRCWTRADFRDGSISTELGCPGHVRFTPGSDRTADIAGGPATPDSRHRQATDSGPSPPSFRQLSESLWFDSVDRLPPPGVVRAYQASGHMPIAVHHAFVIIRPAAGVGASAHAICGLILAQRRVCHCCCRRVEERCDAYEGDREEKVPCHVRTS